MRPLLLPLAASLLLAGCDLYTGPTQVSGTVEDAHTGQPVPNATVQVMGGGLTA